MDEKQFEAKRAKFLAKQDKFDDPLERVVEKHWNERAKKKHGWTSRKLKNRDESADPDRMYMRNGVMFFIEFKRKGKTFSAAQLLKKIELEAAGFNVFLIDRIDDDLLDLMFL